jgi:putative PEP-CTERM system histidine kinase
MLHADWLSNPAAWSYGLGALFFLAFAVHLSVRWRGDARSSLLLAFILLSTFWAATSAAYVAVESVPMWWSARLFDAMRMLAALAFLSLILAGKKGRAPLARYSLRGGLIALAAALSVVTFIVGAPPPGADAGTRWDPLSFVPLIALSIFGLMLVEQLYRRIEPAARWNMRPLVLAFAGIFAFDLVLFADAELFRFVDPHLWAARGMAHAFAIPLLALAAVRNPDWSFGIALSRGLLARSTALAGAAVYLLVIAGLGYFVRAFGGNWGNALATLLIFGAGLLLALVALSETFRSKVRVLVAKNFLAYRYDYREEWLKFTRTLSEREPNQSLADACVRALASLVESSGGGLWLRDADGGYQQRSQLNSFAVNADDTESLVAFLKRTGWVIDVAEVRRHPSKYEGLQLPAWLERMPAWLIVPLPADDELVGFVVLHTPRVRVDINWEVLDLLRTAGRQAASYLAHMQATDALLEARKFEAFNRMSAFVVHDLKNLVAQLQLMLRNAERHRANPEFQRDMLSTVGHAVERMNQMMRQLRSGEAPVENPRAVDLASIARRVQILRAAGNRAVQIEARDGIVALGHEERLERVIGHLVQNALDAAGEQGRVTVRVGRDGEEAVVEVSDNGPGMSSEFLRERLFKPFETTKATGMGIGAYESDQYVRGVGGRITVDSELGKGTTVRVMLRVPQSAILAEAANSPEPPTLERAS